MPDKKLINKKLEEILSRLEDIDYLLTLSLSELYGSQKNYLFAERVMERLIAAAIDINMHLCKDLLREVPEDYFQSFIVLSKTKIISRDFAKEIAPSASLRNIIVHEYQNIDEKKFSESLKMAKKNYTAYAKKVHEYLEGI